MAVTKPYKFIGFGAMAVTKPYNFIGFGAMAVTVHWQFWMLDPGPGLPGRVGRKPTAKGPKILFQTARASGPGSYGPKPYKFIGFGAMTAFRYPARVTHPLWDCFCPGAH